MTQRRRLDVKDPAETAGRTGCLALGAVLGIAAGVVVALFIMPRVFDHYFGVSDIFIGETYDNDGKVITLESLKRIPDAEGREYPGQFEAVLHITARKAWPLAPSDWELELTTGARLDAIAPDPAVPDSSLDLPLGDERRVVLRFPGTDRRDAVPEVLHLGLPKVRFHLEEREK